MPNVLPGIEDAGEVNEAIRGLLVNAKGEPIDIKEMMTDDRIKMSRKVPFWAIVLQSMLSKEVPYNHPLVSTCATDGSRIYYNPAFMHLIGESGRLFVLAHEMCHVIFDTFTRRGDRNFRIWNYASDYVINQVLVETGLEMPKQATIQDAINKMRAMGSPDIDKLEKYLEGFKLTSPEAVIGLHDPTSYKGMTQEQVYELLVAKAEKILKQRQQQQQSGGGQGQQQQGQGQQQPGQGQPGKGQPGQGQQGQKGQGGGQGQQPGQGQKQPGQGGGGQPGDEEADALGGGQGDMIELGDDDQGEGQGQGQGRQRQPGDDLADALELGTLDVHLMDEMMNEDDFVQNAQRIRGAVEAALMQGRGTVPESIISVIEAANKPRVNWRSLLQAEAMDRVPEDYDWARPDPAFMPLGITLPTINYDDQLRACLVVDTSGSMSDDDLGKVYSEFASIMRQFTNFKLDILQCDADIQGEAKSFTQENIDELAQFRFQGRGGTYYMPAMEWIAERRDEYDWVVFFTDGGGEGWNAHMQSKLPPFVWLIIENCTTPKEPPNWGRVIMYDRYA